MSEPYQLLEGVRPSDVRFENIHLLAEWIEGAQRLVDTTAKGREEATILMRGAVDVSMNCIQRAEVNTARLESAGNEIVAQIRVSAAQPIEELHAAARRLELAAAAVEAATAEAIKSEQRLVEYKAELDFHELEVGRRLNNAYAGLNFRERVWAVFSPPVTVSRKSPLNRPKVSKPA